MALRAQALVRVAVLVAALEAVAFRAAELTHREAVAVELQALRLLAVAGARLLERRRAVHLDTRGRVGLLLLLLLLLARGRGLAVRRRLVAAEIN